MIRPHSDDCGDREGAVDGSAVGQAVDVGWVVSLRRVWKGGTVQGTFKDDVVLRSSRPRRGCEANIEPLSDFSWLESGTDKPSTAHWDFSAPYAFDLTCCIRIPPRLMRSPPLLARSSDHDLCSHLSMYAFHALIWSLSYTPHIFGETYN
jgi:hypothetical protein